METDGGPAFPIPQLYQPRTATEVAPWGMSLRDYFAAAAMPAVVQFHEGPPRGPEQAAKWVYEIADAMLAEREKHGN